MSWGLVLRISDGQRPRKYSNSMSFTIVPSDRGRGIPKNCSIHHDNDPLVVFHHTGLCLRWAAQFASMNFAM